MSIKILICLHISTKFSTFAAILKETKTENSQLHIAHYCSFAIIHHESRGCGVE